TSAPCSQLQNVGEAKSRGMELSINGTFDAIEVGANYTYVNRQNLSDPDVELTDTPKHSLFLHSTLTMGNWQLTASLQAASSRINSTDGLQRSAGFGVGNIKAVYEFSNGIAIEGGIDNVTDRLYQYSEGFPEVGRTAFLQINMPFNR